MTRGVGLPSKLKEQTCISVYNIAQTSREGGIILSSADSAWKHNQGKFWNSYGNHFYPILL